MIKKASGARAKAGALRCRGGSPAWQDLRAELISAAWGNDEERVVELAALLGSETLKEGPLEIAAERSGAVAVKALYARSAESSRSRALFRAVSAGNAQTTRALIDLGARPDAGADFILSVAHREDLSCLLAILPIVSDEQVDTAVFMTSFNQSDKGVAASLSELASRGLELSIQKSAKAANRGSWRQAAYVEAFALARAERLAIEASVASAEMVLGRRGLGAL